MTNFPYYYAWKNNPQMGLFPCPKRKGLYGRHLKVIARGSLNSCYVRFENGQEEIISRNAIRRIKGD